MKPLDRFNITNHTTSPAVPTAISGLRSRSRRSWVRWALRHAMATPSMSASGRWMKINRTPAIMLSSSCQKPV